jgi:hypothetical protein
MNEQPRDAPANGAAVPATPVLLDQIETLTKQVRASWLTMLLGCGYAWLTLATMTDHVVKADSISLVLPVLGTAIPPSSFLVFAPAVILVLFIYVHLNMARLWTYYRMLPPIIDGLPARDRVSPWIMASLLAHSGPTALPFRFLARVAALGLGWVAPPLTIMALGGRYITPSWFELYYHSALMAIAVVIAGRSAWYAFLTSYRRG